MYKQTIAALTLLMSITGPLLGKGPSQRELFSFNDAVYNSIAQLMHWGKLKNDSLQAFISPSNVNTVISLLRNCIALWEQHSSAAIKKDATPKRPQKPASFAGIAPCAFQNQLLFLPGLTGGGLRIPGVYHLYSRAEVPIKHRFSCGFHAIYNAIKCERALCGKIISDQDFIDTCKAIAPNNLHGTSYTNQGTAIAHSLGLTNFNCLALKKGRIKVLFDTSTRYTFYDGEDKTKVAAAAVQRREQQLWATLRQQLSASPGPLCLHFSCIIQSRSIRRPGQSESHAVLITAAKSARNEIALYITDNVNEDENSKSQAEMRAYVEHIYHQLFSTQS